MKTTEIYNAICCIAVILFCVLYLCTSCSIFLILQCTALLLQLTVSPASIIENIKCIKRKKFQRKLDIYSEIKSQLEKNDTLSTDEKQAILDKFLSENKLK